MGKVQSDKNLFKAEAEDYIDIVLEEIKKARAQGKDTSQMERELEQARHLFEEGKYSQATVICRGILSSLETSGPPVSGVRSIQNAAIEPMGGVGPAGVGRPISPELRKAERYRKFAMALMISIALMNVVAMVSIAYGMEDQARFTYNNINDSMGGVSVEVSVDVVDNTGNPVPNTSVTVYRYKDPFDLQNGGYDLYTSGSTDATGHAQFTHMGIGSYRLSVSKENYTSVIYDLCISISDTEGEKHVEITLNPGNSGTYDHQHSLQKDEFASLILMIMRICTVYIGIATVITVGGIIALYLRKYYSLAMVGAFFAIISVGLMWAINLVLGSVALYLVYKGKPALKPTNTTQRV